MAIRGLNKLNAQLSGLPDVILAALDPVTVHSAEELKERMQALAPVDTGALRDSIAVTLPGATTPPHSQPGGSITVPEHTAVVTAGNTDVRYPHFAEYGTVDTPAQPYFWTSVRLLRSRIINRQKRAARKAIRDYLK